MPPQIQKNEAHQLSCHHVLTGQRSSEAPTAAQNPLPDPPRKRGGAQARRREAPGIPRDPARLPSASQPPPPGVWRGPLSAQRGSLTVAGAVDPEHRRVFQAFPRQAPGRGLLDQGPHES